MITILFFYLIIFFFGLVVGSFLNCVIYRLEKGESFLKDRSYCPHCHHQLAWYDLIPVVSFFILKGKCRYCQKKISFQYPLVELTTGILFIFLAQNQLTVSYHQSIIFNFLNLCYVFFIFCSLMVIFIYDLKYYIIPDKIIYPAVFLSGLWYFAASIFLKIYTKDQMLNIVYTAFGTAIFFFLIVLISKGKWMGVGDIKLAFLMGLILGFPDILVALFLAFFLGAIIGLGLTISGKKTLKSEIPFGPFLIIGTFIGLFWGSGIINWYLSLFV